MGELCITYANIYVVQKVSAEYFFANKKKTVFLFYVHPNQFVCDYFSFVQTFVPLLLFFTSSLPQRWCGDCGKLEHTAAHWWNLRFYVLNVPLVQQFLQKETLWWAGVRESDGLRKQLELVFDTNKSLAIPVSALVRRYSYVALIKSAEIPHHIYVSSFLFIHVSCSLKFSSCHRSTHLFLAG